MSAWLRRLCAVAASALLHGALVAAVLPALLPRQPRITERAVEVTLELPTPPIQAATAAAPDQAALQASPGLANPEQSAPEPGPVDEAVAPPPVPVEPDVALSFPTAEPPPPLRAPDFGNSAQRPAPEPNRERVLPPIEAPPSISGRELALTAPPAMPTSPNVQEQKQAPLPQQPIRQATPRRAAQQQAAESADGYARGAPSPVVRAATQPSNHPAQQDYLWQIIRKLSQHRFQASPPQASEHGLVVARLTIARDGRLIDVSLATSSGFATLDRAVLDTVRRASPFAALPSELAAERHTFVVPISYSQEP
jgi:protein TonB